jgi:hypothetical protein
MPGNVHLALVIEFSTIDTGDTPPMPVSNVPMLFA